MRNELLILKNGEFLKRCKGKISTATTEKVEKLSEQNNWVQERKLFKKEKFHNTYDFIM